MHLNDLKKWLRGGFVCDSRDHEMALHRNNPISREWFFACRNNNPVPQPPNNNPSEIDDLIERVRMASEQLRRCAQAGAWVN